MARPRRTSGASDNSSVLDQNQELGSMYDYLAKVVLLGPSGTGKSCLLHRFVKQEWRVLSSQTIGVEFSSKIVKIGSGTSRRRIKLQLWDTAGTERFRSVSRSYYRGAAGAILVYDVASLSSFNALPTFLSDARALASPNLTVILAGNKSDLTDGSRTQTQTQAMHMNGGPTQSYTEQPLPPSASSASSRTSYLPYDGGGGGSSTTRSRGSSIILNSNKWTATTAEGREVNPDLVSRWASQARVPVTMEVSAFTGENVDDLFNRLASMILTKIELGEIDPDDPASGIQYGDSYAWDGSSIRSGTTVDDGGGGTMRRRKKRGAGRNGVLSGLSEWEDVFRRPPSKGGRRCC
ncbi:rab family protein [Exophiala viscosa]|uniref:Rab family protein n=1 Tax=Exophiala viscosa TaxID=2486360 RepID=A0AAN6DNM8_9EURO|nr:rab family protein [Exophiala viscosa]KAI1621066.1 rab family protein [Exophiala viscosa]